MIEFDSLSLHVTTNEFCPNAQMLLMKNFLIVIICTRLQETINQLFLYLFLNSQLKYKIAWFDLVNLLNVTCSSRGLRFNQHTQNI